MPMFLKKKTRMSSMFQTMVTASKPKMIGSIFQLFETSGAEDRFGKKASGIGLSTVKKVVEKLGGDISVTSEVGVGTDLHFFNYEGVTLLF